MVFRLTISFTCEGSSWQWTSACRKHSALLKERDFVILRSVDRLLDTLVDRKQPEDEVSLFSKMSASNCSAKVSGP